MATLALKNVNKSFAETEVIKNLNLDVLGGEFIVVVGPSGCGKSTLLRMVAGLESVSSGEIEISGEVVNNKEPKDRNIAMVFQNYALYPHMTVFENMAYGLKMRKINKEEIKNRVEHAAKILGLENLLQRKPKQLSGGQRQRVAMGRAIVRKPALFLFDEPLSNLDAKLRVQMRLEIKKLQAELNTTSLYVTHDQVEAMTLADRIVVLNKGNIEQIGTPLEIYTNPASQFVAGFIGSPAMNFIPVRKTAPSQLTLPDNTEITLPKAVSCDADEFIMGIRPEMLKPAHENEDQPTLNLTSEWVEALGTDTYIYGKIASDNNFITARLSGKYRFTKGETVNLSIDPNFIYLFDTKTGTRINT